MLALAGGKLQIALLRKAAAPPPGQFLGGGAGAVGALKGYACSV